MHQDGLVHISALADKFVKDPHEVVSTGDVVKVKVVEIDEKRKRIALTMKLADKPAAHGKSTSNPNPKRKADKGTQRHKSGGGTQKPQNSMGSLGEALLQAKQQSKK